jgi:CheY-like chemotaxis protein
VKGTGLGLPLSKKLASFLGGSVEVVSELGSGSTFTLRIPCAYRRNAPVAPPVVEPDDSAGLPVLIVEDNPDAIMVYRSYLRDSGFQLFSASTVREAEMLLKQIEPRAIVLDIVLRGEDTWAFMASLKMDESTSQIPIIVVSTTEEQAKGFHLGADAYLVKPVERADLIRQLRELTAPPAIPRVLIIDDNQLDRYLLKQQLKDMPVAIIEASGGADGVTRANESTPDLIFLDLTMPDMTGYDVIEELSRRPETRDIPVVVVTSRMLTVSEAERLSQQCSGVISKDSLNASTGGDAIRHALEELTQGTK